MLVKKIFFVVFLAYLNASYVAVGSTSNAEPGDGFNYAEPAEPDFPADAANAISSILTVSVVFFITAAANGNAAISIAAYSIIYAYAYSDAYSYATTPHDSSLIL